MTISPEDIIRLLLWIMSGSTAALVATLGFLGRAFIRRLNSIEKMLQDEMRMFDRRMTRVETKIGIGGGTYLPEANRPDPS